MKSLPGILAFACLLGVGRVVTTLAQETPNPSPEPSLQATLAPSANQAPESVLDRFEIRQIGGLSGRIAFSAQVQDTYRLFILDLDAGKVRSVVWEPGGNWYPSWSPDGTRIAFVSNRDGNAEIYLTDWEGTETRRLTVNSGNDDHPAFSPQGDRIVFTMSPPGDTTGKRGNLAIVKLDGSPPSVLTSFKGRNSTPDWAPNGQEISFTTDRFWPGWDVCLFDLSQKTERCPLKGRETFCRAAFSHDSARLAYSFGFLNDIDLGVLDIGSNKASPLVAGEGKEYDATWSPDDSRVAFTVSGDSTSDYSIGVVDVTTGKQRTILASPFPLRYLSWNPVTTMMLEVQRLKADDPSLTDAAPASTPATQDETASPAAATP